MIWNLGRVHRFGQGSARPGEPRDQSRPRDVERLAGLDIGQTFEDDEKKRFTFLAAEPVERLNDARPPRPMRRDGSGNGARSFAPLGLGGAAAPPCAVEMSKGREKPDFQARLTARPIEP